MRRNPRGLTGVNPSGYSLEAIRVYMAEAAATGIWSDSPHRPQKDQGGVGVESVLDFRALPLLVRVGALLRPPWSSRLCLKRPRATRTSEHWFERLLHGPRSTEPRRAHSNTRRWNAHIGSVRASTVLR